MVNEAHQRRPRTVLALLCWLPPHLTVPQNEIQLLWVVNLNQLKAQALAAGHGTHTQALRCDLTREEGLRVEGLRVDDLKRACDKGTCKKQNKCVAVNGDMWANLCES